MLSPIQPSPKSAASVSTRPRRVVLVHVRDPQFYALPRKRRGKNGNIRVMGFPPIGIMSLSSVLKRAGHECVMFDQANPETPNDVIVAEDPVPARPRRSELSLARPAIRTRRCSRARCAPPLPTSSSPSAASSPRSTPSSSSASARSRLRLPRRRRAAHPRPRRAARRSGRRDGRHLAGRDGAVRDNPPRMLDRNLDQWPFPDRESLPLDFVESMPLDVPAVLSLERFTTMQTSRGCPWPCIFCDIPIFNEGKWRSRSPEHVLAEFEQLQEGRLRRGLLRRRPLPPAAEADRGDLPGHQRARPRDPVGLRGPRRFGRACSSSRPWRRRTAARSCSASRAAARRCSTA